MVAKLLPVVKYEGELWFFDKRLNELRSVDSEKSVQPYRLDSGRIEAEAFGICIRETKPIMKDIPYYPKQKVWNCDKYFKF